MGKDKKGLNMKLNLQRRELIQGLRGIAIILVVAHHAISNFNSEALWNNCVKFFDMFHVNLFFFIAGYLFMKHREKYDGRGFRTFITEKVKAIFLPYYVSMFLFSLCAKVGFAIPKVADLLYQKGYIEKSVLSMIIDPFWFHKPYFMSLWFIYVLFFYFIIGWFHTKRRITMQSVAIITLVCMMINAFCYNYYPDIVYKFIRYYPYFLLGIMINKMYGQEVYLNIKKISAAFICFAFVAVRVFTVDIAFMQRNIKAVYMQFEWFICAMSALIVFAVFIELLLRKDKSILLVYIGDRSYHVYLLHNPWVIVPVAVITSLLITNMTINIAINFVLGLSIPIIVEESYKRLLSWRRNSGI